MSDAVAHFSVFWVPSESLTSLSLDDSFCATRLQTVWRQGTVEVLTARRGLPDNGCDVAACHVVHPEPQPISKINVKEIPISGRLVVPSCGVPFRARSTRHKYITSNASTKKGMQRQNLGSEWRRQIRRQIRLNSLAERQIRYD